MAKTDTTGSAGPPSGAPIPQLFGTDGVRGTAGRYPLDPTTVRRLGAALVRAQQAGRAPGAAAAALKFIV